MAGLSFPCVLSKQRSEEGRKIRRLYKNDIGVPYRAVKCLVPRTDGLCPTITTFHEDTQIMTTTDTSPTMEHREHPTKEDLLDYFSRRIRVRKMTPREALRLMDVADSDIDRMMCATETVTRKDGTVRVKPAISKTALYRLAGNSIVVSCLYHIFRTMFIPGQPENLPAEGQQLSLFEA